MYNKLKITRFFLITVLMQFGCLFATSVSNPKSAKPQLPSTITFKENKGQACDQNNNPINNQKIIVTK
jgi:hypothetical protein